MRIVGQNRFVSRMFGFNSQFSAANAGDYLTRLFSRPGAAQWKSGEDDVWRPPSFDKESGTTAQDRALSRIISIIWDMQNGAAADKPEVSEYNGYVLGATGTDDDDAFAIKGVSAYDLSSGHGNDTFTLKVGSVGALDAGAGDDTVTITGRHAGAIDGGDGNDTIGFVGDIADAVSGGAGNDTLKIAADAILGVDGGDGDDTIALEGLRIFARGGAGDDTISIRNRGEMAAEISFGRGDGSDTVATNGPLDVRFDGTDAYRPEDLSISIAGDNLILKGSEGDMISITFEAGALAGESPQFEWILDGGQQVLQIR